MSFVLHRELGAPPPIAVRGEGPFIIDATGRRYLDACGGAAVSCLGHSHPEVIEAVREQIGRLAFAHTGFFTSEPAEALAERLIGAAPKGLARVFYTSGGSEACEAALKLARQYFLEIGQPERRRFIARLQSYHGNTLGALGVGGNLFRRAPFEPLLAPAAHIAPCYAYRGKREDESLEAYGRRMAGELEAKIVELGAETVAGFIAEPVVGATLGAVPAVPGYFKRIREICDRYGVLLIFDEVMCGMGRTGARFAAEQEGVSPDLLFLAKGLGAGYQPIGALLIHHTIVDALEKGSGRFLHGHTYMAHATACAAALAVQQVIDRDNLLPKVARQGRLLDGALRSRLGQHPHVGDIRGRGLFLGIEFVKDRESKETFDPAHGLHKRVKQAAMKRGLLVYPMGGTLDGRRGDHVMLAPPFTLEDAMIEEIAATTAAAIDAALESR
ncbi:MAG TPA: aspartate aminotransferase family protein [Alphaproteobacteria bacterium]|nr:aspartate aminotransferase family protein [Alphaproteobacteria bacterium]